MDIIKCFTPVFQKKWLDMVESQQTIVENLNKLNCPSELLDFMLKKQEFEYIHHMKKINISSYCTHHADYIDKKIQILEQAKKIQKCEDFLLIKF